MKKILSLAMVAALATTANAQTSPMAGLKDLHVGVNVALSTPLIFSAHADAVVAPNVRAGVEGTFYGTSTKASSGGVTTESSTSTIGIGVRGQYEFADLAIQNGLPVTPYVGLRAMHYRTSSKLKSNIATDDNGKSNSSTTGFGGFVGARYDVNQNIAADVNLGVANGGVFGGSVGAIYKF